MPARIVTSFAAATLVCGFATPAMAVNSITIAAPNWEDYTNPDGTGFGWAVVKKVYKPAGIEINIKTLPYKRAVAKTQRGTIDAWLGSYADEQSKVLYPKWHFDADEVVAVMRKDAAENWHGIESLRNEKVGWISGYNMKKYIDIPVKRQTIPSQKSAVKMVKVGRIKYYLGVVWEINRMLDELPESFDRSSIVRKHAMNLKLYPAFTKSEKGRKLRKVWDRRIAEMLENGTLASMYDKHGIEAWPFERPRQGS